MVDGNIILSVAKAMELLQALSRAEKPLTLAELTECSGYPKSTVFGLLTTMRAYDVITQTPEFFQLFMYVRIVVIRNNNLIFCHWLSLDFPATSMSSESA